MTIIEQLTYLYENVLPKNAIMLPHEEALAYFERLMMNGNIITYIKENELLGFIEFWNISYEQFGRMSCGLTLTHDEDLISGNVCVISGMWVKQDLRNGEIFLNIGRTFLERNKDCTHFVAYQEHKKHKPVQVYTREDVLKHYKI